MTKIILLSLLSSCLYLTSPTDTSQMDELLTGTSPGSIEFIGNAGSDNVFTIEKWNFTKLENLEDPINIKIEAIMDLRSITTSWKDLEKSVKKKKDYFYTKKFPEARLEINGAHKVEGGYETEAILTLKGISKPVSLQFTMSETAPYSIEVTGVVTRGVFEFTGDGPKEEVPVIVKALLTLND